MTAARRHHPYAVLPLALSGQLVVAFVVVPPLVMPVSQSGGDLAERVRELMTAWVAGGSAEQPPALHQFVEGWRDHHLIKAALAAAAGLALWRVARAAGRHAVGGGRGSAVANAVLTDFAFFHLVLALLAWLLAVGLGTASLLVWRRRVQAGRDHHPTQREKRSLTILSALTSAAAIAALVVASANSSSAADPRPGLAAYLDGLHG